LIEVPGKDGIKDGVKQHHRYGGVIVEVCDLVTSIIMMNTSTSTLCDDDNDDDDDDDDYDDMNN
jgi:hypothetical protein